MPPSLIQPYYQSPVPVPPPGLTSPVPRAPLHTPAGEQELDGIINAAKGLLNSYVINAQIGLMDNNVTAINPGEEAKMQMFIWCNSFFSLGFDGRTWAGTQPPTGPLGTICRE